MCFRPFPLSEVGKEAMKTHRYLPSPKPFAEKKKGSGKELLMVGGALMEVPIEKERERGKRAINLAMASRFWVRRDSKVLLMLGIACKTRVSLLKLPRTFFYSFPLLQKIYLLENTGNAIPSYSFANRRCPYTFSIPYPPLSCRPPLPETFQSTVCLPPLPLWQSPSS